MAFQDNAATTAHIFATIPIEVATMIFKHAIAIEPGPRDDSLGLPTHPWELDKPVLPTYKSLALVDRWTNDVVRTLYTEGDDIQLLLSFDNVTDLFAAHASSKRLSILKKARYRLTVVTRNLEKEYEDDYNNTKDAVKGFIVAVHNVSDDTIKHCGLHHTQLAKVPLGFEVQHQPRPSDECTYEDADSLQHLTFPDSGQCGTALVAWTWAPVEGGRWMWEDDEAVIRGASVLEGNFKDLILPTWAEIDAASDRVMKLTRQKSIDW